MYEKNFRLLVYSCRLEEIRDRIWRIAVPINFRLWVDEALWEIASHIWCGMNSHNRLILCSAGVIETFNLPEEGHKPFLHNFS